MEHLGQCLLIIKSEIVIRSIYTQTIGAIHMYKNKSKKIQSKVYQITAFYISQHILNSKWKQVT